MPQTRTDRAFGHWEGNQMNVFAMSRKLAALLFALSGLGALVATSAVAADAAATRSAGCAGKAFVTNSDDTVSVITTATGSVAAPVPTAAARGGPGLAPDGKHVYIPNATEGTVSVIDTASGAASATITVGANP